MNEKSVCQERRCGWRGTANEMLSAPDPFNEGETIYACPKCKTVEHTVWSACDELDCWRPVSTGWNGPNGVYRSTCHEHWLTGESRNTPPNVVKSTESG